MVKSLFYNIYKDLFLKDYMCYQKIFIYFNILWDLNLI